MERVSGIRREKHLHLLEVLFLGCFVIGIIAANLYGRSRLQQYGILNDYFIQQLKYITIEKHDYFYLCTIRKSTGCPCINFFGMTPWYRVVNSIFLIWSGFFFWLSVRDGNQQYWRRCHLAYDDCVMSTIYFLCVRIPAVIKVRRKVPVRKGTWKAWGMDSLWGIILLLFFIGVFNRGISESRYGALRVEKI